MRWEGLRATDDRAARAARAAPPLPLALPGAVARTFDTPGFAGMTFYEVRAKSLINRVPSRSRVPFEWTINPYRGCSHACTYCLSGDTPILMGDGRTKLMAHLSVGDQIYGTVPDGGNRRLAVTQVLAHWTTVKPAFRVTLRDGTQVVASGDHRFLTERGWKHVTGAGHGGAPRAHLTTGDRLIGTGRFAVPPKDPAVIPAANIEGAAIERAALPRDAPLDVVSVEPLGVHLPLFDITTGTGDFIANGLVSHNCFARNTHTYLDLDAGRDFDTRIVVKVNSGELLRRELAAPKWRGEHIAMGTNVDCYQRAEGRYRLMREIVAALRDFANPFSILTKGTLITRDLDLLRQAREVTDVRLALSIGVIDETLWRSVEPGTPGPRRRLDVVRQLADAGFAVGVLVAPILPGLTDTDESIDATVRALARAGAASVTPLCLHLRPGAREWYLSWLRREHPELLPRYRELYGKGSYLASAYQREVTARVRMAARRYGIPDRGANEARPVPTSPGRAAARECQAASERREPPPAEQLPLL